MLEAVPGRLRLRALVGWRGKAGLLFRKRACDKAKPLRRRQCHGACCGGGHLPGAVTATPLPCTVCEERWDALLSMVLHLGSNCDQASRVLWGLPGTPHHPSLPCSPSLKITHW